MVFISSGMSYGHDRPRVRIVHKPEEGYPRSYDGEVIKEELPIEDFLRRIFKNEKEFENELYRVSKAMHSMHSSEIDHICHMYNQIYMKLLRDGKMRLPQHSITAALGGRYIGGIDPYQQV